MNCQSHLYRGQDPRDVTRRWFLRDCRVGLGGVALSSLLSKSLLRESRAAGRTDPLAPKQPHFPAQAKNVIFLFMAGAPSQLDLFDHKPDLHKLFRTELPKSISQGQRVTAMTRGQESLAMEIDGASASPAAAETPARGSIWS
ncbi:DUF1501 domain-containing protein [bacterium]|nr:DUF1501 domain-containing protein [bacterium]